MAQDKTETDLTDAEIEAEVAKMLDEAAGKTAAPNAAHMDPIEGLRHVTTPEIIDKVLAGRKLAGYAILLVTDDFDSRIAMNVGHGLEPKVRNVVADATVAGLELAKLRILIGSV